MARARTLRRVFAANLRRLRLFSPSMTQAELAEAAGVTRHYVSSLESARREPSFKMIEALSDALDVDARQFFEVMP